jgi:predicted nucleic acid-binding protein
MKSSTLASEFVTDTMGLVLRIEKRRLSPMNLDVIHSAAQITDIPELHDRLIAGTARFLNLELITNDPVIQVSHFVKTVW